jgi:hypothetical protein
VTWIVVGGVVGGDATVDAAAVELVVAPLLATSVPADVVADELWLLEPQALITSAEAAKTASRRSTFT